MLILISRSLLKKSLNYLYIYISKNHNDINLKEEQ